jgi:hypothetical protein
MKAGLLGRALTLAMASCSVPSALGLAFLSKPTWLSEICKKVKPASAACADPIMLDFGMPPATVHKTPVPAQSMHSRV